MEIAEYANPILNYKQASALLSSAAKYKAASKLLDLGEDEALAEVMLEEVEAQGADKVIEIIFGNNQPKAEELFRAIDRKDIAKVIELISKNPSLVNSTNADGNSALFMANIYGHHYIQNYLSSNGATAHEYEQEDENLMGLSFLEPIDPNNFDEVKLINRLDQEFAENSFTGLPLGGLLTMLLIYNNS